MILVKMKPMSQKGWFQYLAAIIVIFISIPLITGHHLYISNYVIPNWLIIVSALLIVYLLLHFRNKKVFPIKIRNNPNKSVILNIISTALTLLFGFIVFGIIFPDYNSIMGSGRTGLGLIKYGSPSLGSLVYLILWFPAFLITYTIFDETDNSWMVMNLIISILLLYALFPY